MNKLYPLKFAPIYKERIWGGDMIEDFTGRELPESKDPIGESWELVDRDDEQSVVVNGELANTTIRELLKSYKQQILGPKGQSYNTFPILVKLIDAADRLSLQVHPDKDACALIGNGAEPKSEMWYILQATKSGKILAGLKSKATKMHILDLLDKVEVENMLQVYDSKIGDGYVINSGTMHAIGGGNLILEIQQNSDTTYRLSDWGRVDDNGNPRELHVDLGIKSVNFTNRNSPKVSAPASVNNYNSKYPYVKNSPFFDVEALHLIDTWSDSTENSMSFHLLSATDGDVIVSNGEDVDVEIKKGETVLVPYSFGAYQIKLKDNERVVVLKTTL